MENDIAAIKASVEARRDEENKKFSLAKKEDDRNIPSLDDIEKEVAFGERGLSRLLVSLMRNRVFYWGKRSYFWDLHYWRESRVEEGFELSISETLKILVSARDELFKKASECAAAKDIKGEESFMKRAARIQKKGIDKLSALNGAEHVISFACRGKDSIGIDGNLLDDKPRLLPCVNGTVNLNTGEYYPGRQEDLLTRVCPTEWVGLDVQGAAWTQFLIEISNDRQDWTTYFQKIVGLSLLGVSIERLLVILKGDGTNGKSILVFILKKVFGELAGILEPEMFLAGMQRSSGSAQPDLVDLKGLRFGFASETDEGAKFSTARVKRLCGNDAIKGRPLHAGYVTFEPSHTLFLMCNHLPNVYGDDPAFWKRARVLPFDVEFVEGEPQKTNQIKMKPDDLIKETLLAESSAILAWAVRGTLLYLKEGLNPLPACVAEAVLSYRESEDIYSPFVKQAVVEKKGNELKISSLYNNSFVFWGKENGYGKIPGIKRFAEAMRRRLNWYKDNHDCVYILDIDIADEWYREPETSSK